MSSLSSWGHATVPPPAQSANLLRLRMQRTLVGHPGETQGPNQPFARSYRIGIFVTVLFPLMNQRLLPAAAMGPAPEPTS
jgi:hypothetical protein